jgi:hypothetical protein
MTCKHCGRDHSDWVGCDQAAAMDAPVVPYTSGGVLQDVPFDPVPVERVKFDRSKAMREYHARKRAK